MHHHVDAAPHAHRRTSLTATHIVAVPETHWTSAYPRAAARRRHKPAARFPASRSGCRCRLRRRAHRTPPRCRRTAATRQRRRRPLRPASFHDTRRHRRRACRHRATLRGMRIYVGSDHAAFELKNAVVTHLRAIGHDPVDCGPKTFDAEDDYPGYVLLGAEEAGADAGSLGAGVGGSGNGEQIAGNKVRGVRAALAFSEETAQLAREHNNANVLSRGARMYDESQGLRFVDTFLAT